MEVPDVRLENREVCKLLGLKPIQLIRWSEAGVVKANVEAGGRGRRRVYNFDNLFEALLTKVLHLNFHVPLTTVRRLVDSLATHLKREGEGSYFAHEGEVPSAILLLSGQEERVQELRIVKFLDDLPGELQSGFFEPINPGASIVLGHPENQKRIRRGDPFLSGYVVILANLTELLIDLVSLVSTNASGASPESDVEGNQRTERFHRIDRFTRQEFNKLIRSIRQEVAGEDRFSPEMGRRRDQIFKGRRTVSGAEVNSFLGMFKLESD